MARLNVKKVRQILKSRRWNTTKLAQEMRVSRSLISLVLSEKRRPSLDFIEKFVMVTGSSVTDVFFLS